MTPERWQSAFSDYSNSSFSEYLRHAAPHLLPAAETVVRRPRSRRSPDLPDAPRDHGKRQQARDPACARDPGCG